MMIFRSTDLFRETYIFSRAGFRMFPADKKGIVLFPPKKMSFTGVALWKNVFYSNFSLPSTLVILQIASKTLFLFIYLIKTKKRYWSIYSKTKENLSTISVQDKLLLFILTSLSVCDAQLFSLGAIILVFLLLLVNLWLIFMPYKILPSPITQNKSLFQLGRELQRHFKIKMTNTAENTTKTSTLHFISVSISASSEVFIPSC